MKNLIKTLKVMVVTLLLFVVSSCGASPRFYRSNAFYINDRAGALLTSTQYLVYAYSSNLYDEDSQTTAYKNQKINGAQVVVATHLGEPGSIDTTKIFNDWRIGANDMGMLFMLYFAPSEEEYGIKPYLSMTREIGERMATYISMFRLEIIFNETFKTIMDDPFYGEDYDYALAVFYLNVLKEIYDVVYNLAFDEQEVIETYEEVQYENYYSRLPSEVMNIYAIPWWVYVLVIVIIVFFGGARFFGGFLFNLVSGSGSRGGGGGSRGYKHTS